LYCFEINLNKNSVVIVFFIIFADETKDFKIKTLCYQFNCITIIFIIALKRCVNDVYV